MSTLNESIVEDAALTWFEELGYAIGHGPHVAQGEPAAERELFGDVVLVGRLRDAIWRLNPLMPEEAREDVGLMGGGISKDRQCLPILFLPNGHDRNATSDDDLPCPFPPPSPGGRGGKRITTQILR